MVLNILGFIWCLPNTIIGFLLGLASLGLPDRDGIVESCKGFAWLLNKLDKNNESICFGYVIIHYCIPKIPTIPKFKICHHILNVTYDKCETISVNDYNHELVHRKQQCQWGIFYWLAYLIAGLIAVLQGKHFYWDNYFEKDAYKANE